MNFQSLGLILKPKKKFSWSKSHCMLPTVLKLDEKKIRIFFGSRNKYNVSSISFADFSYIKKKLKLINISKKPILKPGLLGAFDDNGVLPSSIIRRNIRLNENSLSVPISNDN